MSKLSVLANDAVFNVEKKTDGSILIDGTPVKLELVAGEKNVMLLRHGDRTFRLYCKKTGDNTYDVWMKNHVIQVTVEDAKTRLLAQYQKQSAHLHTKMVIKAPMPGLVTGVQVEVGQSIDKETKLLTLEAMKMENEIRSPIHGIVRKIEVTKGDKVEKEQRLITIEATPTT